MARFGEVIGFTADADIYCVDCAQEIYGADEDGRTDGEGNELGAIFGDSETDVPYHCANCQEFIAESLTSDGYAYVADAMREVIRAHVYTDADGRALYCGRRAIVDLWRGEYGDALDNDKLVAVYDAVRERETSRLAVFLVQHDAGYGRATGTDEHGAAWTDTDGREDGTPDECAECGAFVYSGWLCLDGGDIVCSSHVLTPQDARGIAADWHSGQASSLYALSSSGVASSLAGYDAARELRALDVPSVIRAPIIERAMADNPAWRPAAYRVPPIALDGRWRERDKLRALVAWIDGMRSHGYADAALAIRELIAYDGEVLSDFHKVERTRQILRERGLDA